MQLSRFPIALKRTFHGTILKPFLLFLFISLPAFADPLDHWTETHRARNPDPTLTGIAFGNSTYIAVGERGAFLTSTNTLEWTPQSPIVTNDFKDIVFGGDRFIAVGSAGLVAQTSDTIHWNRNQEASASLNAIHFGAGKFVIVGDAGTILVSETGLQWTRITPITTNDLRAVTFGNGLFVAGGFGDIMLVSQDALNWSLVSKSLWFPIVDICFALDLFVAVTPRIGDTRDPDWILISTNGMDWTYVVAHVPGATIIPWSCASGAGKLVVMGGGALISENSQDWTRIFNVNGLRVRFLNDRFIAVGYLSSIFTSLDGINWEQKFIGARPPDGTIRALASGNGRIVAFPEDDDVLLSSDGVIWTNRVAAANAAGLPADKTLSNPVTAAAFGNNLFVAALGSQIFSSSNGIVWEKRHSLPPTDFIGEIRYLNGHFVAVGAESVETKSLVVVSPDGLTWTNRQAGDKFGMNGVAFGNGRFVAVGASLATSDNGDQWQFRPFPGTNYIYDVAFGRDKFVAVGLTILRDTGVLVISTNGLDWSPPILVPDAPLELVRFVDGRFVAAGPNALISSVDAINWTRHKNIPFTPGIYEMIFTEKSVIAAGSRHRIWSSGDFTRPWFTDAQLTQGVFNLKLWIPSGSEYELKESANFQEWNTVSPLPSHEFGTSYETNVTPHSNAAFFRINTSK